MIKEVKFGEVSDKFPEIKIDENMTIYEMLNETLKPVGNVKYSNYRDLHKKIKKYDHMATSNYNAQEIYTDSKCLYASAKYINEIIEDENI